MRQGAEFLDTSLDAWARWEALRPTCLKVRFGVFSKGNYREAFHVMRQWTNNPLFLLRPQTEVPDLVDLRLRLSEEMSKVPPGVDVWLEPANEPNQTETRKGLGNTTAEQVVTYRSYLAQYATLHQDFPEIKLIAPGLMPEPDGIWAWMVEERGLYDFDGCHVYGSGLDGLMLPARFYAPPVITEIGSRSDNRSGAVIAMMQWLAEHFPIQAFVHFAVPEWRGPDGLYTVSIEDAQAYAAWHDNFHQEREIPMPTEFRDRWPTEYVEWKAASGVSDIDFLAWVAATKGYEPTPEEFDLIANAVKGNVEALKQLALRPKA